VDFSSLWFWGLARELGARLQGGTVAGGRVFPASAVLTLACEQDWDLLFWLDPRFPRVECLPSRGRHELPERWRPLLGAHLAAIDQPDCDRRVRLSWAREDAGFVLEYFAFPRPSLVVRDGSGRALIEAGAEGSRATRPGKPFLMEVLDVAFRDDPRAIRGLDDLWLRAALASGRPPWEFIVLTAKRIQAEPLTGFVVLADGNPVGVSLVDFSAQLPELVFEDAGSLSHASSKFVAVARRQQDRKDERVAALNAGNDLQSRLAKTLKELERDRRRQEGHRRLQEDADWLLSQLAHLEKGQTEITVRGTDGERRVALDPRIPPHDQADRWYQEARRLRRGMAATQSRIDQLRGRLNRLEALLRKALGRIEADDQDAESLFTELEALAVQARAPVVRVKQEPLRFRRFRSPGGLAIWVGRNNRENDELTLHAAHKEDLWFHAQQCPGSHVVLRSHALGQAPPAADLVAAASTAAYYSRARTSKKVPVIYTLAKYVRKPRKAPPGKVTVEREKSVMVEPRLYPEWDEPA
jgi:predicted ribosome quality control (RQC) complex YloA/Tae2 family protein